MTIRLLSLTTLLALPLILIGCNGAGMEYGAGLPDADRAVAVLHGTEGNPDVHGTVTFTSTDEGVRVVAEVHGLNPNGKHGFHIHEWGDCTAPDATSAGGHYNPEGHPHGLPPQTPRHAGDLGNLQADEDGNAHYDLTVDNITIAGRRNPIIGRSVIVHAGEDDGSQPLGDAGPRIACGVIGIAE